MKHKIVYVVLFAVIVIFGCSEETYQPKPKGYFRLQYPDNGYQSFNSNQCPFAFDFSKSATVVPYKDSTKSCWMDIVYPIQNAKIHLSYHTINGNLSKHIEDSRTLVYKHTVKANNIQETLVLDDDKRTYALLYEIGGNAASSMQFFITDSTTHFFRGALYFLSEPNADSLQPAIEHIGKDVKRLIETFQWNSTGKLRRQDA